MISAIRTMIYGLVFLFPFIIFSSTFYPMVYSKSIFLQGVTLAAGVLYIIAKLFGKIKESGKVPLNIVFPVFGAYAIFIFISGLNSIAPGLAFWGSIDHGTGVIFIWSLLILSLITASVFKTMEEWYRIFLAFVFSGIFFNLGTYLTMMGVRFSKIFNLNALSGFLFGNSSWTGVYLAFVLFVSLGLILAPRSKAQRVIGVVGFVSTLLDPTLTGYLLQAPGASFGFIGLAKTGSYSLIACGALILLYAIFRRISSYRWQKIFLGSIFGIGIIGMALLFTVGWAPVKDIISKNAGPNRFVFWEISLKALKERPFLGWGGDSYQYAYAKYFDPIVLTPGYAPEYWVDRSHNIYFDELVTGGVPGFLLLISLYAILLFGLGRSAIHTKEKEGWLYMALLCGLVSFLIQGLMMFQINFSWFMVAMLLAFAANFCFTDRRPAPVAEKNKKNSKEKADDTWKYFVSVMVVLAFFPLFTYAVWKPYRTTQGLALFPKMKFTDRIAFYKKLDKTYMGNTTDLGNAFLPYHIMLRKILERGVSEDDKKLMVEEIKEINRLLDNSLQRQEYRQLKILMGMSGYYSLLIALTDGKERQVHYDQAIQYIQKMKEASPQSPTPEIAKALLDISLKYGEDGLPLLNTDKNKVNR